MATPLTEHRIELLNGSDLLTAMDLLEEHGISTDDVETIQQAQSKLWARLAAQQKQEQTEVFHQATEYVSRPNRSTLRLQNM